MLSLVFWVLGVEERGGGKARKWGGGGRPPKPIGNEKPIGCDFGWKGLVNGRNSRKLLEESFSEMFKIL